MQEKNKNNDYREFLQYETMSTAGLVINEKVVCSGA